MDKSHEEDKVVQMDNVPLMGKVAQMGNVPLMGKVAQMDRCHQVDRDHPLVRTK